MPARFNYSDVPDLTKLNCSCHFANQYLDAGFVSLIQEYRMTPLLDGYVSNCLCLYNATSGAPEHCAHTNFSANLFDWCAYTIMLC